MRLSLVISVYNRRDVIVGTVDSALRHLGSRYQDAELIVVDEGSTDDTAALLEPLASEQRALRVLRSAAAPAGGQGLREGMHAAAGDCVVFTDVDLAYPLAELDKVLAALDDGADVAIATRADRESRILVSADALHAVYARYVVRRIFDRLARVTLGLDVTDAFATLKGLRRSAAQPILARQTLAGLGFHVELLFLARRFGFTIREIPVLYRAPSARAPESLRGVATALVDLWKIRRNERAGRYR